MQPPRRFQTFLGTIGSIVAVASLVGCTAVAAPASEASTVDTVSGVGELMPGANTATLPTGSETLDTATVNTTPVTDPETTTTTIPVAQTIGAKADGNRVLMIGDSITASISKRYGGEACDALVPLGWQIEVDAEVGRFVDFGKTVLDKRLDAGWNAAIIFLGTNYGYKRDAYQSALHAMLLRLVPRPTVLINTSLFRPQQQEVNDAIAEEAALFTSVTVIDWATLTQDPALTGGDNIHLTEAGRRTLAYQLAGTMGSAPITTEPGECLKTNYTNDSAGSPYGPTGNANVPKTTVPKPRPTQTTAKPGTSSSTANTTATTKATGSSSSSSSTPTSSSTPASSSSTATTPTTAAPPTTPAPATTAAPTIPTLPPATPTTAAPTPTTATATTPAPSSPTPGP